VLVLALVAAATCSHQSMAEFPASARDLTVGPLTLVGGRAYTSPQTVKRFGGQKYPALVAPGHTVRLAISRRAHRTASLTWADGHRASRSVTLKPCSRREAGSEHAGRPVTFWSGAITTSAPRCLTVNVFIDGASRPRRARIPIGRRC
jgi:hypothetical protein